MRAQETARMSAFRAAAMVGIETMKIRLATPEKNCPTMALTRSSTSVCLAMLERMYHTRRLDRRRGGGDGDRHRVHDVLTRRPMRADRDVRHRHRDQRDGRRLAL